PQLLFQVLGKLRQVESSERQESYADQRIHAEPDLLLQRKLSKRPNRLSDGQINKLNPSPNRSRRLNRSQHLRAWRRTRHLTREAFQQHHCKKRASNPRFLFQCLYGRQSTFLLVPSHLVVTGSSL